MPAFPPFPFHFVDFVVPVHYTVFLDKSTDFPKVNVLVIHYHLLALSPTVHPTTGTRSEKGVFFQVFVRVIAQRVEGQNIRAVSCEHCFSGHKGKQVLVHLIQTPLKCGMKCMTY